MTKEEASSLVGRELFSDVFEMERAAGKILNWQSLIVGFLVGRGVPPAEAARLGVAMTTSNWNVVSEEN
jgi:hypothetical protein